MNLTSDESRLHEWAEKECNQTLTDQIFSKKDVLIESYYDKCTEKNSASLMYEYGFDTFIELKTQLMELWKNEDHMQEAVLISTVAAMKNKSKYDKIEQFIPNKVIEEENYEIPEYVYVF